MAKIHALQFVQMTASFSETIRSHRMQLSHTIHIHAHSYAQTY